MKLSATAVKNARTAYKNVKLADGGGLYLLLQKTIRSIGVTVTGTWAKEEHKR